MKTTKIKSYKPSAYLVHKGGIFVELTGQHLHDQPIDNNES